MTYNRLNVTAVTLAAGDRGGWLHGRPVRRLGQVGQEIVVPPEPIG